MKLNQQFIKDAQKFGTLKIGNDLLISFPVNRHGCPQEEEPTGFATYTRMNITKETHQPMVAVDTNGIEWTLEEHYLVHQSGYYYHPDYEKEEFIDSEVIAGFSDLQEATKFAISTATSLDQ